MGATTDIYMIKDLLTENTISFIPSHYTPSKKEEEPVPALMVEIKYKDKVESLLKETGEMFNTELLVKYFLIY